MPPISDPYNRFEFIDSRSLLSTNTGFLSASSGG